MCLAVPLRVVRVAPGGERGIVAMGGAEVEISLVLVEGVRAGDYVIVHAGMAIERLDEAAARETLALLEAMEAGL